MEQASNGCGRQGPVRMCCMCRHRHPKAELTRYVRADAAQGGQDAQGNVPDLVPDLAQRLPGRGVYVCCRQECRERFLRRGLGRKKR